MVLDLTNVAYSAEYQTLCNEQDMLFAPTNKGDVDVISLEQKYEVEVVSYQWKSPEGGVCSGHLGTLYCGKERLHSWKCYDDSSSFFRLIHHSDGNDYLLFRQELYGFSVYNITTDESFQYLPKESFGEGETFIWTDVSYHAENNLLAVSGCYWACPWSVYIVDFASPLSVPKFQLDIRDYIDGAAGCEEIDDLDFETWLDDGVLLKCDKGGLNVVRKVLYKDLLPQ